MADIRNEVIDIINKVCDTLQLEPEHYSMPLRDVGVDSLDLSSILLELEEHFNIGIPEDDVEKLATIDRIVEYVTVQKGRE